MEKFQHIRAFIAAASEYEKHPTDSVSSVIQMNLGAISASLDPSIFDPSSSISTTFYIGLYELMNSLGSKSSLIWSAVDVLQAACKNCSARNALIHTYKFAPILSRLLEANLTSEKRTRALKLLQELTYGIKISWQEAHLPHLITTLSKWATESNEEEVISLSLGVLVNLCYKNLPAVYTLMRSVNTKTFLQNVVRARRQSVNIRVQCCKLLIILEHTNSDILDSYILDVAAITFTNIIPTLKNEDVLLLRHLVDFFDDIRHNEHYRTVLLTYPNYVKDVKIILESAKDISNRECASLLVEFLSSLMKLKVPDLLILYPVIIKTAMGWVPIEYVASKALSLIRTIVIDSRQNKNLESEVLEELDMSMLTLFLVKEDDDMDGSFGKNMDKDSILIELMQLFQELIKTPAIKTRVLEVLTVPKMQILMKKILECNNDSQYIEKPRNLFHDPTTDFYIHALALIADLATNSQWLTLYTELLQRKQMQMIMATALFTGDRYVKQKVLHLTSTVGYPKECVSAVAGCMAELEPLLLVQANTNATKVSESSTSNHPYEFLPLFSKAQEERLDISISKIEHAFKNNQLLDMTTSAVMELYEYKVASMRHAERSMQASLEAASNHATSLQHRLAQLIAQSSQLHQVLFNTQQCLEGAQVEKNALAKTLHEKEEKSQKTHALQVQENKALKKIVLEKENQINLCDTRMKELEEKFARKNEEITKLLQKAQEDINRKEQIIEEKNREISSIQKDIEALNQEIEQQAKQCLSYQKTIVEKEESVQKLSTELHNLSRMRDMIFELAKKKDGL
ncbi:uncharacterized protein LOC100122500 [Nasonia vitripennis]|uniref:Protein CIP2A n=1 Tax=Nasonia vitripennis TaxID=7425 RepID=A0A7M7GB22_NASVI|nr:uncharacterized protein LOC100122500 [Nasonia vitripennis]